MAVFNTKDNHGALATGAEPTVEVLETAFNTAGKELAVTPNGRSTSHQSDMMNGEITLGRA